MTHDTLTFWIACSLLAFTYGGYPALLALGNRWRRPGRRLAILPRVSLLVLTRNDADRLGAKLRNLLTLDYPAERLEIVVADAGSDDGSLRIARRFERFGVKVMALDAPGGRNAQLNALVPQLEGDIVVPLSSRGRIDSGALRALVQNFADPRTGCVTGRAVTRAEVQGGRPEVLLRRFLRRHQSRAGLCLDFCAGLYAFRRRLFQPLRGDAPDHLLLPLSIARSGYQLRQEPEARLYRRGQADESDFGGRIRYVSETCQLLSQLPGALNPLRLRRGTLMLFHRVLLLLAPFCLVALLVSNFSLMDQGFYRLLMSLQILFYSAAIAAWLNPWRQPKPMFLELPYRVCLAQVATILGCLRFFGGTQQLRLEKAKG